MPSTVNTQRFHARSRGFTLVELLVVVGLIALSVSLVAMSISRSISGAESRQAARKMVAAIRYTRTQAILKKSQTVFTVDTEEKTYQAPGREPVRLPEGMDVVLTTARSELTSEASGGIRFFLTAAVPGGTSN